MLYLSWVRNSELEIKMKIISTKKISETPRDGHTLEGRRTRGSCLHEGFGTTRTLKVVKSLSTTADCHENNLQYPDL
jgi:hypothetical protein